MAAAGLAPQPQSHALIAHRFADEVRFTSRLGIPLALGELGWMSTYIVDALMVGRLPHSALAISASSLGNTIFYAIAFCAVGMLTGIETLVAQAYGRGDRAESSRLLWQSFWFVLIGTPLVMTATLGAAACLHFFGTPADIVAETRRYLNALVWSTAPLLLYWAVRRYLQSINRVLLIMVSLLTAGIVNFAADWILLYGHFGFPALGIAGSGWATCIVRVYALALLLVALRWGGQKERWSWSAFRPDTARIRDLFRVGWPASLEGLVDLGVSTCMSILCARLGTTLLAAHQVVLDLDAFIYMVPLGLSYATATRVGQSAGRRSLPQVRRSAQASLLLGIAFITIAASLFASFPHLWASLYTNDQGAIAAAAPIFVLCGILQFGDAAGIILAGALVGIGDTRTPLVVNLFWSWALGMPLSYWLTFHQGWGLTGLWTGRLVAALGSSLLLALLWQLRLRRRAELSVSLAAT